MQNLETRVAKIKPNGMGKLIGYAAVYRSLSEDLGGFREQIAPGAFDASLANRKTDVRALWNHDSSTPLARQQNGTLSILSDQRGLRVEIDLPQGVSYADDLRALVDAGVVNQMSFGFVVSKGGDSWDGRTEDGLRLRTLHAVDLHEVSVVSIPAYASTTVALRSMVEADCSVRQANLRRLSLVQSLILRARLAICRLNS